ncbi:MAG: YihA family ribosome biogenesis GTP-binding protein [Verrucomicrobia bacterium]|nr:YihA family ribosome biogenesis GTP-binding protein [Verrucomicrobiota bacterium]
MKITSSVFQCSAPDLDSCPPDAVPEFAFIGRSNVGKSSLLNALTGRKGLAKVSDTPGFTKLINFFMINNTWRLVDLPGYGFAKVARDDKARFNDAVNEYLTERDNLAGVFVLIDSGLPPQKIDLEFVHWLGGQCVPLVLVFTKTDKGSPAKVHENVEAFKATMAEWFETLPEIFTCSSVTRHGLHELLTAIDGTIAPA